jgi:Zn-dependent M28 family amino/carboxypeptidase
LENNIIAITTEPLLKINEQSGYQLISFDTSVKLIAEAGRLIKEKKNYIVLVNSFHTANFGRLKRFKRDNFKTAHNVIFVLHDETPARYNFEIKHEVTSTTLSNVVAVLPGKTKKDEYVIFSAHYDHLGTGKPDAQMDSIYNGANDDASGVTAMIMLANYFSKMNSNERSIVFVAFTAEETGGFGSSYFSTQINPDKVSAMFNIEMIGTESKWGTNSAYITGFDKSDFGKILQQNLAGTDFHFEPDPYPKQNLFYRSDNATLAALGVPAHTISTSKMDEEKFYHTQEDEIETLNMVNMTAIIKARLP